MRGACIQESIDCANDPLRLVCARRYIVRYSQFFPGSGLDADPSNCFFPLGTDLSYFFYKNKEFII